LGFSGFRCKTLLASLVGHGCRHQCGHMQGGMPDVVRMARGGCLSAPLLCHVLNLSWKRQVKLNTLQQSRGFVPSPARVRQLGPLFKQCHSISSYMYARTSFLGAVRPTPSVGRLFQCVHLNHAATARPVCVRIRAPSPHRAVGRFTCVLHVHDTSGSVLARTSGRNAASPCGGAFSSCTLAGRPACGGALCGVVAPPAAGRFAFIGHS
jgi:hypothetical protein